MSRGTSHRAIAIRRDNTAGLRPTGAPHPRGNLVTRKRCVDRGCGAFVVWCGCGHRNLPFSPDSEAGQLERTPVGNDGFHHQVAGYLSILRCGWILEPYALRLSARSVVEDKAQIVAQGGEEVGGCSSGGERAKVAKNSPGGKWTGMQLERKEDHLQEVQ